MKLRIEIDPDSQEEILLRAPAVTDEVRRLQTVIAEALSRKLELALQLGERECYIPCDEILFFETTERRVSAHTAEHMYFSPLKLCELEELLPRTFVRASKSCLVNTAHIAAINHSLTGASEILFKETGKKIYASRMYYKIVHDTIEETRLRK